MTREEANRTLSLHLMQCGAMMPIEWVRQNGEGSELMEAFRMALDALREQEERSKGCPYCLYLEPLCRPNGDVVAIETDGKQYVIEGDYWGFDIKFCPNCGCDMREVQT